jgi:hypothetical protein
MRSALHPEWSLRHDVMTKAYKSSTQMPMNPKKRRATSRARHRRLVAGEG